MTDKSTLAEALAKAQANMQNAPLNKTNKHFGSSYADLAAIRDAVTPALSANGLAITQTPTFRDGAFVLVTTLRHTGGETVESIYPLAVDKPQVMGSALTYARRYSLAAMCGIAADEDDDANAAQTGEAKPQRANTVRQPEDADEITERAKAWVQAQLDAMAEFDGLDQMHEWEEKNAKAMNKLEKQEPKLFYTLTHGMQMFVDAFSKTENAA